MAAGKIVKITSSTTRTKKSRRRGMRKVKVPKAVKAYVKQQISAEAENKYTVLRLVNQGIASSAGVTPTAISLLPSLAVGSTRYNRSGNQIKLKNGFIYGRVNLLPYNSVSNINGCPIAVKMWLLSSAQYNEIGAFGGTAAATAFFKGDITPTGMSGNVMDLLSTVEDENFRVYATKTIILGASAATNNFPSTNVDCFTTDGFSAPFYFNWSKHFKRLKYNDTSAASIPTNRNLWLVFQAVSLDGRSVVTQPAEFHCSIENHYEDF